MPEMCVRHSSCLIVKIWCTGECSAGYYCDWGSSSAEQSLCPAGFYCPTGTPKPLACTSGTFSSIIGNSQRENCEPCPEGYYCQGEFVFLSAQPKKLKNVFTILKIVWKQPGTGQLVIEQLLPTDHKTVKHNLHCKKKKITNFPAAGVLRINRKIKYFLLFFL